MARRGRRSQGSGKRKNVGQWYGIQAAQIVIDSTAIDNFIIVPPTTLVQTQSRGVYRGMQISVAAWQQPVRSPAETVSVVVQKTEFSGPTTPANVIDPVSTSGFDLGNGDVLWWDQLEVPVSMGGTIADDEPMVANTRWKLRANRKLDLRRHGIIISMSSFTSLDTTITINARAYVQY